MTVELQPSLFDTGRPGALGPLTAATRSDLAGGAWVDHLPGWVDGSDEVLDALLTGADWRAERRPMYDRVVAVPRLTAWYANPGRLPHPALVAAHAALSSHYAAQLGEPLTSAGLCLYRDGRDSVAWHGDTIGRGASTDTVVAILSFGSARTLALRPRTGGPGHRFQLGHGDLLVMGGSCQRTWEHAVPKTARHVGPRVSVQLRPAGVA
jgi:alkylated DNA repair dioxygenase AlkB